MDDSISGISTISQVCTLVGISVGIMSEIHINGGVLVKSIYVYKSILLEQYKASL